MKHLPYIVQLRLPTGNLHGYYTTYEQAKQAAQDWYSLGVVTVWHKGRRMWPAC